MSENKIQRCILDGEQIESLQDVYASLKSQLEFPAHFGKNMDALWDVLSTDIPGPIEVVWHNSANSEFLLEDKFDKLIEIFDAVRDEREDFSFILD